MRQEGARVEINCVATRWLHDRNSVLGNVIAQISSRRDTVAQVIFFERFLHTYGNRLKVAASKAAVRRIALGEDEKIFLLTGEHCVIGAKEAADIGHAIFLR